MRVLAVLLLAASAASASPGPAGAGGFFSTCDICEEVTSYAESKGCGAAGEFVCGEFPFPISNACEYIVDNVCDELVRWVAGGMSPESACTKMGFCSDEAKTQKFPCIYSDDSSYWLFRYDQTFKCTDVPATEIEIEVNAATEDDDKWFGELSGLPGLTEGCCGEGESNCRCTIDATANSRYNGSTVVFSATNKNRIERAQLSVTIYVTPTQEALQAARRMRSSTRT